jgi:hypothetical protein
MNDDLKHLQEAYNSIYENIRDLAKQDPREAFPHIDDMDGFENETEEDLYKDENEEECPCGGDDDEGCSCSQEEAGE